MEEWPEGLDLAALLEPIPGDAPAGQDLREDESAESIFRRFRDARGDARIAALAADAPRARDDPAPMEDVVPLSVRWRAVRDLATEALILHSKDLEFAASLTEALVRSDGLIGVAAGSRLMAGLIERFWDGMFPQPDEDGIASRVAPVALLNGIGREGTLMQPLRRVVLFPRPDGAPFEFWQYQQSRDTTAIADPATRQQRFERDVVPFQTVEDEAVAARTTYPGLFDKLRDHAASAAEEWRTLGRILDSRAGVDAPPTSQVRELLEQIEEIAKRFATPESTALEGTSQSTPEQVAGDADRQLAPSAGLVSGEFSSREDALRALAQIANYFRRMEPNSPIAYTLQEAVRRGRMTWPELLAEIVPDAISRSTILSSLGIRPPSNE